MSNPLREILGPDVSDLGDYPCGEQTVVHADYRGMTLAAAGRDVEAARAALIEKVTPHAELLKSAPRVDAADEVNVVLESQGEARRHFVRPMSPDRAAIELQLGVCDALVFVDEGTGGFAVATRGPGGVPQTYRIGTPVHGDDSNVRPIPVPGRTPPAAHEPELVAKKAERIRPLLRCPETGAELEDVDGGLRSSATGRVYPLADGRPFLALNESWDPTPDDATKSQNTYGQQVLSLIEQFRDGWVLDCGSGSPTRGFYNVVHLDLFAHPNVDVVTDGGNLPFADETFDAVLSEAVLEHVEDPDAYVREVGRVLKPGGLARLDAAFMQPYHGYPDHYFNMTKSGLRLVVERNGLEIVELAAGRHQHASISLSLMLNRWIAGTPDEALRRELGAMTLAEAIERLAAGGGGPFDGLAPNAAEHIAAGFGCIARKPD